MKTRRTMSAARRAALAFLALGAGSTLAVANAAAADRLLLFGGEVADAAYYSFVGTVLPAGARRDGRGWYQRYWVDAFGYEYEGGPGRVQADAYGLEASLGYGASDELGWWSVSFGLRYTDTSLDPDDVSANARGSQLGGKFQVDFERTLADRWRLGGIGSYTSEQDGYWVRGRLMHGASATRALGLEALANGNDEADATAVGLVKTFEPGPSRFSVGLKAGYRFQDDADGAYAGAEFGYRF
ncbi:MAG TPA: cellulose biosynthesis protein BcsS [Steroidobacteraceae bacterium]|nr:cellulose biosynthesis protein BcsS [Steroidobacteraceae bacterium]